MMGASLALVAGAVPASLQAQSFTTEVRGGASVPAGDLNELGDPGAVLGVGLGWRYGSRITLRVDGDWEMINEDLVGDVVTPRTYLWHLHGGVELDVTNAETSTYLVRLKGSAGGTIYDTKRFTATGDDFVDTYFSVAGGLSAGRMVTETLELGLFGKVSVIFTDEDRTQELADLNPALLNSFSKASSFPVGLYLRWQGLVPQM
jgi:hypothetical protein